MQNKEEFLARLAREAKELPCSENDKAAVMAHMHQLVAKAWLPNRCSQAESAVRTWARLNNDGKTHWPGPDGLGNRGDRVPDEKEDRKSRRWRVVELAIRECGTRQEKLRELLTFVYLHGRPAEEFVACPLPWPNPGCYPREIRALGIEQGELMRMVIRRVLKKVEKKLVPILEFERNLVQVDIED